ncbi:nucleotide-diphospho-sugar transferase [Dactylonectria macrodidyma]|uniref:Nucleotide-diphospho-sugar transferase n=1 Tax=Dactylonectria macrodidyma TaxID=307937 RepID=A0A9P9EAL5_9HYPO|nr:nucleotide-diphospho-sugar transferase [Dactylonectria macrodidyma]
MVLEDATASVDQASNTAIQKVLSSAFQQRTILVIVHRLSSITTCNRVTDGSRQEIRQGKGPRPFFSFLLSQVIDAGFASALSLTGPTDARPQAPCRFCTMTSSRMRLSTLTLATVFFLVLILSTGSYLLGVDFGHVSLTGPGSHAKEVVPSAEQSEPTLANASNPPNSASASISDSISILPSPATEGNPQASHPTAALVSSSLSPSASTTTGSTESSSPAEASEADESLRDPPEGQRFAFATFLSTRMHDESLPDPYFTATRVLLFQLLHQPETKIGQQGGVFSRIPVLVLVAPHVSKRKREILEIEGATIIEVDSPAPLKHWMQPAEQRWIDQFSKLNLWTLTQFDRILYLDNDMLLTRPLDPIFNLPEARQELITGATQKIRPEYAGIPVGVDPLSVTAAREQSHSEPPTLPPSYLFLGVGDMGGPSYPWPPLLATEGLFNGGFYLMKPDLALFKYYTWIMDLDAPPKALNTGFMEQGLLNFAHRHRGPLPISWLSPGVWNVNWPTKQALEHGAASLHDKFWNRDGNEDWIDRSLVELWFRVQGRMEGYWLDKRRTGNQANFVSPLIPSE